MCKLLTTYEIRLQERAQLLGKEMLRLSNKNFSSQKFSANGEIKPYFGLTCIAWVDSDSALFQELCSVQNALQTDLTRASLGQYFAFLDPTSFHMTVCDITASITPLAAANVDATQTQIEMAFENLPKTKMIMAQVEGIGLCSTITALVRFQQETELQKVQHLENTIKQAVQVNVRDFLGHITLAYGLTSPDEKIKKIRKVLQPYQHHPFGALTISEFDLTYFTDMNTYHSLATVDFTNRQIKSQPHPIDCGLT